MNAREPTWFVRLRGHTLGPLSMDELRKSVREGEISPEDKLNRAGELLWRRLADYPELYAYWESIRRPVFVANVPSPQLLWKKSRPQLPTPMAPAPVEIPAAIPAAPQSAAPDEPAPRPKKTIKKAAPKKKTTRKAKIVPAITEEPVPPETAALKPQLDPSAVLSIEAKPDPAFSLSGETAAEKPIEIPSSATESEPVAQPKTLAVDPIEQLLDPTLLKLNAETLFPLRPEVPNVEPVARPAHRPAPRWLAEAPRTEERRQKILRIAALLALVLAVAGIAYWAGQKTRDLKELPLSDPSSPTTQLPAASDPIQPLRAPTRPQRD